VPGVSNSSWPTINQLAGIGSVVVAWSWLELAVESLLTALVQSDDMLSQALTENLSPDHRLSALVRLAKTWERMVRKLTDEQRALLVEIRDLAKLVAKYKGERNKTAHWIWLRQDDTKMFGWKHHVMPTEPHAGPNAHKTTEDLLESSKVIGEVAHRVANAELAARNLPLWPGASRHILNVPGLASLPGPYLIREEP
jgi:hypothetical protein